jgi:hypothetical protein
MSDVNGMTSMEARLLDANMKHFESELKRHGDMLSSISQSLQTLARVEQSQVEIKDRLKEGSVKLTEHEKRIVLVEAIIPQVVSNARDLGDVDKRLIAVETALPSLVETRRWVIAGILAGVAMIGVALIKLIFVP